MNSRRLLKSTVFWSLVTLTGFFAVTVAANAQTITRFYVPPVDSEPSGIAAGADGAMWFTDLYNGRIGRVSLRGNFRSYKLPAAASRPTQIVSGPLNDLWFTEQEGRIGRISTSGRLREYTIPSPNPIPIAIAVGPDGAIWFGENGGDSNSTKVGRLTVGGKFTEFPVPWKEGSIFGMTAGPDGAIWFTDEYADKIARVNGKGVFSVFSLPESRGPAAILTGRDGALWFTEEAGAIGRMTTDGRLTEYPVPTRGALPDRMAIKPSGAIWFTEWAKGKIGEITPNGKITEIALQHLERGQGPENPYGIAVGANGMLWVTTVYSSIYRVAPAKAQP